MIGRGSLSDPREVEDRPKGFDDFDLTLGDIMRGERATKGKSLLDVQRDLKIRAPHVAAIENADPSAFDTPSFVPGFVRSYARYLGLDPEWAFNKFCAESGFAITDGMSAGTGVARGTKDKRAFLPAADALGSSDLAFQPVSQSVFAQIEPRAVGSSLVLVALIGGLGYGAWSLLQEVQRVTLTPVEQAPTVAAAVTGLSNIEEVSALSAPAGPIAGSERVAIAAPPSADALERLYRPAALDVPVMVARDAPIASLNPDQRGLFAVGPRVDALPKWSVADAAGGIQVLDGAVPELLLVATEPTWVRVESPGQSVVYEQVLEPGESYAVPVTEETPILRAENASALYFRVNGTLVGPAGGETGGIADLLLASTDLSAAFPQATRLEDSALFELLDALGSPAVLPGAGGEADAAVADDTVVLVAVGESWIRIRDAADAVRFEGTLQPQRVQDLPDDIDGATLARAGNAGDLYFRVGDTYYGPAGAPGTVAKGVNLDADAIRASFTAVDAQALGLRVSD